MSCDCPTALTALIRGQSVRTAEMRSTARDCASCRGGQDGGPRLVAGAPDGSPITPKPQLCDPEPDG